MGFAIPIEECPIHLTRDRNMPVRVHDEVFWRKDGTQISCRIFACPLVNNGQVTGIVRAFQDVTERRRLDRMKDEFISTVSHELRTPLTSLRAALGLIAGGALDRRPGKSFTNAECRHPATATVWFTVVNDILDFERIGSGQTAPGNFRDQCIRHPSPRERPANRQAHNAQDLLSVSMLNLST